MVTFVNKKNTCYFNVILQLLIHCKSDHQYWNNNFQKNWIKIVNKLSTMKNNTIYDPEILFKFLKLNKYFKLGFYHDAHEVLLHILDIINDNDFGGEVIEYLYTIDGKKPYETSQKKVKMLSLDISIKYNCLIDCLTNYFMPEKLSHWIDSKNNSRDILIGSFINKYPNFLIILLRQNYINKKYINCPFILDILKFTKKNSDKLFIYVLTMVIIHNSMHYYCYCLENNYWYKYDDESRIKINNIKSIFDVPPYILIYKRELITSQL